MATKRGTGSGNIKRRLAAFGKSDQGTVADWSSCDCEWLQAVVAKITSIGGAVTIGLSRDMGSHMMTLLLDKEKEVLWFNGDADLTEAMKKIMGELDQIE